MSNKAAWLTKPKGKPLKVDEVELPKAGPDEVVIKNHAVAVNPVDWKVQDYDFIIKEFPNILGTDVAGEVYEVGQGVTHVQKGDRVLGHCFSLLTNKPRDGGFQTYTVCNALVVAKIPSSLSYTSAAVLPLSISTAAACLFKKEALSLPLPGVSSSKDQSILVWGGSSSIGASAIQLAVGAGVKVVTVASKHNIEKVKQLGASEVFDYNSSSVVENIISALQGTQFVGVCDCIGSPGAAKAWTPVYKKLGGKYASVEPTPQCLPEGIEGAAVFAPSVALKDRYIGEVIWAKWVPEALEEGTLQAKPDPVVIEGGLEKVQDGLERQKEGVSFAKIVVEL